MAVKAKSKRININNKAKKEFFLSLPIPSIPIKFLALICVHLWLIFLVSCQTKPTDLRSLTPAETVIYLETNDLSKTLEALTASRAFSELAKEKPDFSPLQNVQFAVAVAGFETSESDSGDDETAILNFKPRFVAIADMHRWNFSAAQIAENQIGNLARAAFGETVKFEKRDKPDAEFFVWTNAADNRKIFAAVADGVIYVATDEKLIDECLAVKRGAAENLLKNANLARARTAASGENQIAFGYVAPEGVREIAALAGISAAADATENEDGRNFVARFLPPILQKTVREISWTANRAEQGIEDKIFITANAEVAPVLSEILQPSAALTENDSARFLPADVYSATRYNLQNPQTAWRGLLSAVAAQTDQRSAGLLAQFSNSLLESYGVSDADTFLSAIDSEIYTARFDDENEKSIVVATVKNTDAVKKSLGEIDFKMTAEKLLNGDLWKSGSDEMAAAFVGDKLILGDADGVSRCLEAERGGKTFAKSQYFQRFSQSSAAAVTFTKDADSTGKVVELLSETKLENKQINFISLTETRFTANGIERRNVSAFGLIGSILERF